MISNEQLAIEVGNNRDKLKKEFQWTLSVLKDWARKLFPGKWEASRLDFENRRYMGDGCYLQWRVRRYPDQPESYENQQTNRGRVEFIYGVPD